MADRFFVEGLHAPGDRVAFARDDAHKLANVLRKRSGDRVVVVDSGGVTYEAELDVGERGVSAVLGAGKSDGATESALRITLAQAVPKGQKMDFVVEKATELGVHAIVPVRTARVIGSETSDAKVERWRRIAKSAAQQSGRTHIPQLGAIVSWPALIATFGSYDRVVLPWELADPSPLRDTLGDVLADARSILIVVGPEGGLSNDEVGAAQAGGARVLSLGRRILRTETAALVLLAAIAYASGEL
jgi:16S rRNA (uracil1498-N3)-methyltransferase